MRLGKMGELCFESLEALAQGGFGISQDLSDIPPSEPAVDAEDEQHLLVEWELGPEGRELVFDVRA
jgi:hypothetical protein